MAQPTLSLDYLSPTRPNELVVSWRKGNAKPQYVYFRSDDVELRPIADALLCLGLPAALEVGAPLKIVPAISEDMNKQINLIGQQLCRWYTGLNGIDIVALSGGAPPKGAIGRALFYSAGVDSSFSVRCAADDITHLVTLIGADIPLDEPERIDRLVAAARSVAATYGKKSIIIETNVRDLSDRMVGWVEYHGAVLAAVAHMLSDEIGHVRIASSADESSRLRPWGTHPDLDPLWGAGGLTLEHHELVPRFSKVAGIVDDPALMKHLRVCDYDDKNCGRCPDCIFMLNALSILNAFDRAPTFREKDRVNGKVIADGHGTRSDLLDMRAAALSTGYPSGLPEAIDSAIRSFDRYSWWDRKTGWSDLQRRFKLWKRRRRYRSDAAAALDSRRP